LTIKRKRNGKHLQVYIHTHYAGATIRYLEAVKLPYQKQTMSNHSHI